MHTKKRKIEHKKKNQLLNSENKYIPLATEYGHRISQLERIQESDF